MLLVVSHVTKSEEKKDNHSPQATPIVQLFRSLEINDPDMLMNSFNRRSKDALIKKHTTKHEVMSSFIGQIKELKLYPFDTDYITLHCSTHNPESSICLIYYQHQIVEYQPPFKGRTNFMVRKEHGYWKIDLL